ncbi:hypothetical protein GCM10010207_65150 [Streptomyces atratus]|uniref:hypothetical protein n=1 Tax=Streptomyces atratus TaxID=1893 RepID=UPI00166FF0E6|nr:hypothetical protein [Streptomyces atratus]GGT56053.1 hypothetical protein GCM10010207_65150 [Streptomyces atratus]
MALFETPARPGRLGLVLATPGGITYEGGGAHVVINQFVEAFPALARRYEVLRRASFRIVAADIAASSENFRGDLLHRAQEVAAAHSGGVDLIRNGDNQFTGFADVYGPPQDIERRRSICRDFVSGIERVGEDYDRVAVLAHEDHLSWLPTELDRRTRDGDRFAVFWFPHTLSEFFSTPFPERRSAEQESLSGFRPQDRVVSVGGAVDRFLRGTYGVSPDRLVKCYNEIYPDAARYSTAGLDETAVPDRPFALFCGRMNSDKRPDVVLDMYVQDTDFRLPDLLFIAPAENRGSPYVEEVFAKIAAIQEMRPGRIVPVTAYQSQLVHQAIQSPNVRIVLMPSAMELRSILSLEYCALLPADVPVVYNEIPALTEVFARRPLTFVSDSAEPSSFASSVHEALAQSASQNRGVRDRGSSDQYCHTYAELMDQVTGWLDTESIGGGS